MTKSKSEAKSFFTKGRVMVLAALVLTTLIAIKPFFKPGITSGHDIGSYVMKVQLFHQAMTQGQFPVRWVDGYIPGTGQAHFQFYPPLLFYLVGLWQFLPGIDHISGLYLGITTSIALGWVGAYLFARRGLGLASLASILVAILFVFTPYRFSQLYVRASFGEYLATSLMPFAFLGISLIFKNFGKDKKGSMGAILITSLSISGILTAHQPTLLIAAIPLVGWFLLHWVSTESNKAAFRAILAGLISLGLTAFFTLPLIGERQYVSFELLRGNYYDYRLHFATLSQLIKSTWDYGISQAGPNDNLSFSLGILNWLALIASITAVTLTYLSKINQKLFKSIQRFKNTSTFLKNNDQYFIYFCIFTLYVIFMSTSMSLSEWRVIEPLGFIQYPWRFLSLSAFTTASLAGLLFEAILGKHKFKVKASGLATIGLLALVLNVSFAKPSTHLDRDYFDLNNPELVNHNQSGDPTFGLERGYLPRSIEVPNLDFNLESISFAQGGGNINEQENLYHHKVFEVQASEPSLLRVATPYFPGWIAKLTNKETKQTRKVTPLVNTKQGLMEIPIEIPGSYEVELNFERSAARQLGDAITGITILGITAWTIKTVILPRLTTSQSAPKRG